MKKLSYFFYLLFFIVGCTTNEDTTTGPTTDPAGSSLKSQQAYESLEIVFTTWANGNFQNTSDFDALNFKTANSLYKDAVNLDPNNLDAHLGAAITEILCTYADTAVNRVVKQWESFGNSNNNGLSAPAIRNAGLLSSTSQMVVPVNEMAKNLFKIYSVAKVDPPLISDMQNVVKTAFLPRIDYAIQQLSYVEKSDTFKFRVSGKMQGDANLKAVYIYPTEIYFTDALLHGVKSLLEGMLVYKFDLPDYKQASLLAALAQNSTSFLYLAADGNTHSQNAKGAVDTMISKMLTGINKLETISGTKSDAIVKIGQDGIKQTDLDSVKTYLNKAKSALTGPITIHLDNVGTDQVPMDIQVNLGNFFDNPVANPKASFLPPYTVSADGIDGVNLQFNAKTYADFKFPDPTFGGVFPGMTNENMKKIMHIDEEFGFRLNFNTWWTYSMQQMQFTVKIVTATKTYSKLTDGWGFAKFVIIDQDNVPYSIWVNDGQKDYELSGRPNASFIIKAKSGMDHSFRMTFAPSNLQANNAYSYIWLNWNEYDTFFLMRGVGSASTPSDYQKIDYSNNYYDYSVTNGQVYKYVLRTSNNPEDYYMGYGNNYEPLVLKSIQYSNPVTITKQ